MHIFFEKKVSLFITICILLMINEIENNEPMMRFLICSDSDDDPELPNMYPALSKCLKNKREQ